jgi:NitT/TauT family transport system substrate-binding protein
MYELHENENRAPPSLRRCRRTAAQAEGKIRIAEQFGVVYLLLNVAQDQKLIEKHGKKQGVDIEVDWVKLSGGAAVNDALLSNSVDVVGAGLGPC